MTNSKPSTVQSTISNVRLPGNESAFDLLVSGGTIEAITPHNPGFPTTGETIFGNGDLAVPAFVDGHVHLDKTFLGIDWVSHAGDDTVQSRIMVEKALRAEHAASLPHRAKTLARQMLAYGTTALRTHVDIDETNRLINMQTIFALREELSDLLDMQIVAFPQSGLNAATVVGDLEVALRDGADVLGGLDPTTIDGHATASLDTTFTLAARFGVGIDMHLHEPGETGVRVIEGMCRRTKSEGMEGRVVLSHGFCLADIAPDRLAHVADQMAAAGIALMTSAPGPGPLVPVPVLLRHGVRVFTASDNIRDAWAPSGNGDMLDRARLLAYRTDFRTDAALELAFDCVTRLPAEILGFAQRGPSIGSQADMVLLPSPSIKHAVCDVPKRRRVIRRGHVVAQ